MFFIQLPPKSPIPVVIDQTIKVVNLLRHQFMSFSDLMVLIESNSEPYSQFYHPAIHAPRSYITIDDYESTNIIDEQTSKQVLNKLNNKTYKFKFKFKIVNFIVHLIVIHLKRG